MSTTSSKVMQRIRWLTWALIALLVSAVAIVWSQERLASKVETKPYAAPFQLVNQHGDTVTEQDVLGKPSAWFYGFTHCPDVCPTALAEMAQELMNSLLPEPCRLRTTGTPERMVLNRNRGPWPSPPA
ncbi:MAG: SCO family protein [Rhizobium sp.]|nr:SCO family protein [Rhizobium sp.]